MKKEIKNKRLIWFMVFLKFLQHLVIWQIHRTIWFTHVNSWCCKRENKLRTPWCFTHLYLLFLCHHVLSRSRQCQVQFEIHWQVRVRFISFFISLFYCSWCHSLSIWTLLASFRVSQLWGYTQIVITFITLYWVFFNHY